ncbi:TetR/AcrR family transcriptional regulator [Eubacteriales bacterium OttesenSCG-928-A19]|nr:TetR/AcrR family transcriptional regulator [Eubacteriales bacterium OttesenSCG-928-A19]
MKKDTKNEIIKVAKALFNERGYNHVTTQNIADAIGISKGNLNYHFDKKEAIIEAVVEEMHSHYIKPQTPTTLDELNARFLHTQEMITENAFYFWDYTQLAQMSSRIKEIQHKVIGNNYALFDESFKLLNKEEILLDEEYPGQYGQVIQAVVLTCTYWTPHSRFVKSMETNGGFLGCVWAVIYPLLTEKGKAQYNAIKHTFQQ